METQLLHYTDYRQYLKDLFVEKIKNNPSFSLRQFAKQLGLAPGTLSKLFSDQKGFSVERSYEISEKLGFSKDESEYFSLLVQSANFKGAEQKARVLEKLNQVRKKSLRTNEPEVFDLTVDHFKLISDWYHFGVIEALPIFEHEADPETLAKFLGITSLEVRSAIDRLVRLEVLKKDKEGKYRRTKSHILFNGKSSTDALRKFNQQVLEKARAAIEAQNTDERVTGTETMRFDRTQLDEVRELTNRYLNAVTKIAHKGKNRKNLYHVNVQFFKLDQTEQKIEE